ncbi:hypothetical protein BIU95_07110 [Curtobacterium sp. MCBA15_007]|uniref:hypothetical protein n=1 Tax=Curtobacterium sp. MCBA15_007 TaxID=1898735 RepID=UPI0008DD4779|nr:hypothetical protein [Curtobacterium sp. MCBA15_007]OII01447.1 hypothetical protein BIU95_07110 [Curtobacterium sp. MCBA15_007]
MRFVLGAWINRRYTRLPSSIVLGLLPGIFFIYLATRAAAGGDWFAFTVAIVFVVLQALAYPLARESYFRVTQPMREGIGGWILSGPLALFVLLVRFNVYVYLWVLAIPVAIAGFFYLAFTERAGNGWRLT